MRGAALRIRAAIATREPERLRHHRTVQQMRCCDGVKRADTPRRYKGCKFFDDGGKAAFHKDIHRAGPHDGRRIAKEDARIGGLQREVEIGVITGGEAVPRVACGVVDAVKFIPDFGIDGTEDGLEQPGLVLKMVMQRATGHACLGGQCIERDMGEPLGGKGLPRGGEQARGSLFCGLGPALWAKGGLC